VNNFLKFLLIFFIVTNCSLNKSSNFWTKSKVIKKEKKVEEIFKKKDSLSVEINSNLKISLYSKVINNSFFNNYDNNNGRINYDGDLKNLSKFKFSKIDNFHLYNPEISFNKSNIIFFDNKGTIFKFDNNSKLLWSKNFYSKIEKKQKPILSFANNNKILIVADNITKYYAIDINSGKLLWNKNNKAPFNSQLKIYKDKFFLIDFDNVLRCFSIKDGSEIWNIKTEQALIRSQKKLSLVIIDQKIYFNNSLGDISSVDITTGELLWQSPTQSTLVYDEGYFLKTSDIIADRNSIYFSNNKNQFFSIDIKTGFIDWKQSVNSNLRPTLVDDYIFTISLKGYLIVLEKKSGKIIRVTDIFNEFSEKKRLKIYPVGFIVGKYNIYLTTSDGKLIVIDTVTGKTNSILKIDNKKISRPFVLNQNLYIVTENSIIKLN